MWHRPSEESLEWMRPKRHIVSTATYICRWQEPGIGRSPAAGAGRFVGPGEQKGEQCPGSLCQSRRAAGDHRCKSVCARISVGRMGAMPEVVKIKVEPLTREAFAPLGEVIESYEETRPQINKGRLRGKEVPDSSLPPRLDCDRRTVRGRAFWEGRKEHS